MPRGDKSSYTDKQKRKARDIVAGYTRRGVPRKEAERRAWATVNKESGGGNKSGSGRGKRDMKVAARKGGSLGGRARARPIELILARGGSRAAARSALVLLTEWR
jgi:plasmid stabilization system protein ParE